MAKRTPIKAIRAKCLDCCCDSWFEVKICPVIDCPLWEYRLGHRPKKDAPSKGDFELETEDEDFTEEDITEANV